MPTRLRAPGLPNAPFAVGESKLSDFEDLVGLGPAGGCLYAHRATVAHERPQGALIIQDHSAVPRCTGEVVAGSITRARRNSKNSESLKLPDL